MTLRDYFAGLVMQATFAGPGARMLADRDQRYDETNWSEVVAANAYEMADAMLAAREPVASAADEVTMSYLRATSNRSTQPENL